MAKNLSAQGRNIVNGIIETVVDTVLIARVLREWEETKWRPTPAIGEREVLALAVLERACKHDFLERELGGILGLPNSSASDLVKKLIKLGLVQHLERPDGDRREKPLRLSAVGISVLQTAKRRMADHYRYLFSGLGGISEAELSLLGPVVDQLKTAAIDRFREEFIDDDLLSLP